jgi:hypothetical protein
MRFLAQAQALYICGSRVTLMTFIPPIFRTANVGLLPDFVLAFALFTPLAYGVLARRLGRPAPALAASAAIGLSLSFGLIWWEASTGWSIRDLGTLAVGFALLLMGAVIFRTVREIGGGWAGIGTALGISLLIGWVLGLDWPLDPLVVQTAVVVALLVGLAAFWFHRQSPSRITHEPGVENRRIRRNAHDIAETGNTAQSIRDGLRRAKNASTWLKRRPALASDVMLQLRRLLPIEGRLTQRVAGLRANAHLMRAGHSMRIRELQKHFSKLSPAAQRKLGHELRARYEELRLDQRIERLDIAVAKVERRVRSLTIEAEECMRSHNYRQVPDLLERAAELQDHNVRLIAIIERSERRLLQVAKDAAHEMNEVKDE